MYGERSCSRGVVSLAGSMICWSSRIAPSAEVSQAIARVQGGQTVPHLKAVAQAVPIRVGPARIRAPGDFVGVAQAIAIGIDEDVRHQANNVPAAIGVEAYLPTVDLGRRAIGLHYNPAVVVVAHHEICRAVQANGRGGPLCEANPGAAIQGDEATADGGCCPPPQNDAVEPIPA